MDAAFSFNEDCIDLVQNLYTDLSVKYKVYFYAEENRPFLSSPLTDVTEMIYSSLPVIFFVTEGWLKSEICLLEYEHAQINNKPVLYIKFVDCELLSDVQDNIYLIDTAIKRTADPYEDLLLFLISWLGNKLYLL